MMAINSATGKVLMVNSGTMDEGSFRQTVSKSFPSIKHENVVIVCDGQIRPTTTRSQALPQAPSPGKGVVWKGSFCFPPSAKVLTVDGIKEIKDIVAGDMVFTHLGHPKKVLRTYHREWAGEMVIFRTALDNEEIILTPAHNVMAVKGSECVIKKRQVCKPTCQTQNIKITYPYGRGWCYQCTRRPYQKYAMDKIPAGELSTRDFLFMPKLDAYSDDCEIDMTEYLDGLDRGAYRRWSTDGEYVWPSRKHNETDKAAIARAIGARAEWLQSSQRLGPENRRLVNDAMSNAKKERPRFDPASGTKRVPAKHKLCYDFGRLLGLYAAEGSGGNVIAFAFHKNEVHLHNFVKTFVKSEFGLDTSEYEEKPKEGMSIITSSVILGHVFKKWCGHDCYSKKIPGFIFSADDETITGFINGLWDGDGTKKARLKDNTIKYGTVSPSLAYGLRMLLSRFGVTAAIGIENRKSHWENGNAATVYVVRISGEQLYRNEWLKKFKYNQLPKVPKTTVRSRQYYASDEGSFVQITSVTRRAYNGPVFDLEVEDDHTYLVNSKAFSNSDLGGYANMNREIVLRLPQYGFSVRIDVLPTGMQVDPMTASLLNVFKNNRLQNEAQAPLVIGFTPMAVQGRGRKVAFFTMMETQRLHPEFVNRCNTSATEVWVPCGFYERVFRESGVVRPVFSVPLGVNHNLYTPGAVPAKLMYDDVLAKKQVSEIPERFKFASVFGWSYRKGADVLCKSFIRQFDSNDDACLVIHSRYMGSSHEQHKAFVRAEILGYYNEVGKESPPPIYYNGDCVPIPEMPGIYTAADCFVFCSRGEGFGLPVIEAGACGIPVISAYNTAMEEYLDDNVAYLVKPDGYGPANERLTWISEYYRDQAFAIMGDDQIEEFGRLMRRVVDDRDGAAGKARLFRERILSKYTWDACTARVAGRLATMTQQ
jgi:glycosyltransferase involved in cell wall biosynthesis